MRLADCSFVYITLLTSLLSLHGRISLFCTVSLSRENWTSIEIRLNCTVSPWDNMNVGSEFLAREDQRPSNRSSVFNAAAPNTRTGTSNGDKEHPAEASTNNPLKRLACDACRDRKVRCDRQHPTCSRCARLGHSCNYSGPSKQAASKVDWSQLIMTLHSRLGEF